MKKTFLPRALLVLAMSAALCAIPQGALAQRGGGHGGFGGFHGGSFGGFHGGGFGGFHGGNFGGFHGGGFGGFRGPGFGGFRGGFGWRGGSWGYPRFGWGWGWNFGFGFGPYWGWDYPYYYGSPWWGPYAYSYPYAYGYPDQYGDPDPYYGPSSRNNGCDYRYSDHCPDNRQNGAPPRNIPRPNVQAPAARPSSSPTAQSSPDYRVSSSLDYRANTHGHAASAQYGPASYTFAEVTTLEPSSEMRPAVQNVVQALRAMPPDVRERQLNSGRYASFSPAEKELLQKLVQSTQSGKNDAEALERQ